MAERKRLICDAAALAEAGEGFRFDCPDGGEPASAFVVRFHGKVYGYLNRCAHVGVELDWQAGRFFDDSAELLVCATHGATYDPATGLCVNGPCKGERLIAVPVEEVDGRIWMTTDSEKG